MMANRRTVARGPAPIFLPPSCAILPALALGLTAAIGGCSNTNSERPRLPLSQAPTTATIVNDRYDSRTGSSASQRLYVDGQSIPKGGGHFKLGAPYKIAGRWYVPTEDANYDRSGIASWYGRDFHGRKTSNGEIFDMYALTAAHPTLPLPSYAYVTSLQTGRTVLVRINDRGPYVNDRIMDLSRRTAEVLGVANAGISNVRVRYAGRAPLNGDDRREQAFLAAQPWMRTVAQARPANSVFQGRMGLLR